MSVQLRARARALSLGTADFKDSGIDPTLELASSIRQYVPFRNLDQHSETDIWLGLSEASTEPRHSQPGQTSRWSHTSAVKVGIYSSVGSVRPLSLETPHGVSAVLTAKETEHSRIVVPCTGTAQYFLREMPPIVSINHDERPIRVGNVLTRGKSSEYPGSKTRQKLA